MKWAGLLAVALGMALIVSSFVWVEAAHREVIGAVLFLGGLIIWRLGQMAQVLGQCRDVLDQSRDRLTRNNVSLGQMLVRLNELLGQQPAAQVANGAGEPLPDRRAPVGRFVRRSRAPVPIPPPEVVGACPQCQKAGPLGKWCSTFECQGLFEFAPILEVDKAEAVARWTGPLPKVETKDAEGDLQNDLQLDEFPPSPADPRGVTAHSAAEIAGPQAPPAHRPRNSATSELPRVTPTGELPLLAQIAEVVARAEAPSTAEVLTIAEVLRRSKGIRHSTTARMTSDSLPAPPDWDEPRR
jgi:hypothetical protein